ncbi:MAG: hypothetical protein MI717_06580 [Spirochaetales bacterium]|nr:hypothetical protein [Spirochaetales bacterium]
MIRKVYVNGQVSTLLVYGHHEEDEGIQIIEALRQQAERIEVLEAQNQDLVRQGELLAHLVEMTARTGEMMSQSLQALQQIDEELEDEESLEGTSKA